MSLQIKFKVDKYYEITEQTRSFPRTLLEHTQILLPFQILLLSISLQQQKP